ncbi:hypothetical protein GCM10025780_25030 [Frondihabitans cladoniiphilus]|uniref:Uncharacterized protein n=1 Tax=Frondihabitans cladoniiphilus TaxID=715785 RepID=A0ABP8W2R9_9MICO
MSGGKRKIPQRQAGRVAEELVGCEHRGQGPAASGDARGRFRRANPAKRAFEIDAPESLWRDSQVAGLSDGEGAGGQGGGEIESHAAMVFERRCRSGRAAKSCGEMLRVGDWG